MQHCHHGEGDEETACDMHGLWTFLESRFDQIVLACKNFLSLVEKESVWLQCLMYHSCGLGHYWRPKMGDKHS